ncbi:MAG: hypothetical protein SP4CHLAM5_06830 [Chlamydiia bacterium]|nr:hypothetical protein [Chlamydiia bacterium]MCH9618550.1 hypothetical protein [Chlamydiia bacterium]MCH9624258.1 hypothetical protein [Chlamydiia bacterium]
MATFYQTFTAETSPPKLYTALVSKGKAEAIKKFKAILHQSAFLHLSFSLFILVQSIVSLSLFLSDFNSMYTPASFAILFLAITSYMLIAFYQKNRKLDAIDTISKEFRHCCSIALSKNIENTEKLHLAIAECMRDLSEALHTQELFYLTIHPFKFSKSHIISHFLYFHYGDILYLQEKLLDISLNQHSFILADCACNLEFHSSLSKTYATLAGCHKLPKGKHLEKAFHYSNMTKKNELSSYFDKYYILAIEELKIVCELSGNESWSILDLASLYARFGDYEKEMEQYEQLVNCIDDDKEILYRLGVLYFMHHKTSCGLKMYNQLRKLDALYAKNLLSHYNF